MAEIHHSRFVYFVAGAGDELEARRKTHSKVASDDGVMHVIPVATGYVIDDNVGLGDLILNFLILYLV